MLEDPEAVTAIIGSFAAEHLPAVPAGASTGSAGSAVAADGPVNGTER
jgi:hypothetical protein